MKMFSRCVALLFFGLFALQAGADRITVYYADGTSAERETSIAPSQWGNDSAIRGGGGTVTLDTMVEMRETVDFQNVLSASPGQTVNMSTFFNALGSLEVPFEQLIGTEMLSVVFAPRIGLQGVIRLDIEAGDENVIGYGVSFTIPVDAEPGNFRLFGLNQIDGLEATNNSATVVRRVRQPPVGN